MDFTDIKGDDKTVYHTRVMEGTWKGKKIPRTEALVKMVFEGGKLVYMQDSFDSKQLLESLNL